MLHFLVYTYLLCCKSIYFYLGNKVILSSFFPCDLSFPSRSELLPDFIGPRWEALRKGFLSWCNIKGLSTTRTYSGQRISEKWIHSATWSGENWIYLKSCSCCELSIKKPLQIYGHLIWLLFFANIQLIVSLLKILCTNIAWQRRKLGKILQDWGVLSLQVCLSIKNIVYSL